MGDVGLFVQDDESIDIEYEDGDLKRDDGLETPVIISMFSDARAEVEDLESLDQELRGYWGDMYPDVTGDEWGSRIWTTYRRKVTNETRGDVQDKTEECLKWFKDDGIASSVKVETTLLQNYGVSSVVKIKRPMEKSATTYNRVWDAQGLKR